MKIISRAVGHSSDKIIVNYVRHLRAIPKDIVDTLPAFHAFNQ